MYSCSLCHRNLHYLFGENMSAKIKPKVAVIYDSYQIIVWMHAHCQYLLLFDANVYWQNKCLNVFMSIIKTILEREIRASY